MDQGKVIVRNEDEIVRKNDEGNLKFEDAVGLMGDMIGRSMEKTFRAINQKNKLDNVAIFVDYDNVYWSLMKKYLHDPDHEDDDKNLFVKLWKLYGRDNIRLFKAYADFQQIKANLTRLQKKRIQIRHVYANGKTEDQRKNASDIELSIDAIETTYKDPNITCYVFVTADSDMIPIMSRLMYKGKHVELFYIKSSAPRHTDITMYAHESYDLIEFLNVDTTPVDYKQYVDEALNLIHQWHEQYANTSRSLGTRFLHTHLTKNINIPDEAISRLIDHLRSEKLIVEDYKLINGQPYPNYVLNLDHEHIQYIQEAFKNEVASSSER